MAKPAAQPEKISKKKTVKKRIPERLVAKINLSSQTMNILVDGKVKHNWKISSGAKGHHTPTGSYKPYYMTSIHYSKKYDNAPMPHSVFFRGGYAIHATGAVRRLGNPASHGCVRLSPGNAKKFFKLVQRYKKAGTRIKIAGSTPKSRGFKKRYARASRPRRTSWDNYTGYAGNYVSYSARRRPAANTRRIRIGRPTRRVRRTSHGRIFSWQY
ncbi:MAG: L,D-transpeptidase [bacterium]|nr:L,D-transpeptidase [bacterium]